MKSFYYLNTVTLHIRLLFSKSFLLAKESIYLLLKFSQAKQILFAEYTYLIHFIF